MCIHSIKSPYVYSWRQLLLVTCLLFWNAASICAQKQLFILNRSEQTVISVPLQKVFTDVKEEFSQMVDPYDLIKNMDNGEIYWSEGYDHQIKRLKPGMDERFQVQPLSTFRTQLPVDLEIDDLNHKMYWVDNAEKQILRANLDGSQREVIPADSLSNPVCLTLVPSLNLLFYADLDQHQIWSSTLNGENRKVLVNTDAEFPVRLLADPLHGKLYWANDGEHLIERINLDGSDREIFYQGLEEEHPFGLLLDSESRKLYWTDYGTDQVMSKDVDGEGDVKLIASDLADPVALILINRLEAFGSMDNPITNDQKPGVTLFPNPANKEITFRSLHSDQSIEWVRIYDRVGNEVFYGRAGDDVYQLDIFFYADGYYTFNAQVAGQILSGHFSIIH